MTLIYIIGFAAITFLSLRSIAKSLKKGATSFEYSRNEMKVFADDNYAFTGRK